MESAMILPPSALEREMLSGRAVTRLCIGPTTLSMLPGDATVPAVGAVGHPGGTCMKCPQCRHDTPTGAKFCPECGTALPATCASCGHALPVAAKFCPECGH